MTPYTDYQDTLGNQEYQARCAAESPQTYSFPVSRNYIVEDSALELSPSWQRTRNLTAIVSKELALLKQEFGINDSED